MAKSPSHELGEKIGNFLENAMKEPIKDLCKKHSVYFDCYGKRATRKTQKVTWEDINGSKHDLDYVIERNGDENNLGNPIAFIELAWRRYTKHSKNKVQEIAGAILPISEKYSEYSPFKGAILSGVFTTPSINQLKNQGFNVLYIPYEEVIKSFKKYGVDLSFDENTSEKELKKIIRQLNKTKNIKDIEQDFILSNKGDIDVFMSSLESTLKRNIDYVFILPLHGKETKFNNIEDAWLFLDGYSTLPEDASINRYIVGIRYNNGSSIDCSFNSKLEVENFLKNLS